MYMYVYMYVCITWGSNVLIPEYPHTTAPTHLAGPMRWSTLLLSNVTGVTSSLSDNDSYMRGREGRRGGEKGGRKREGGDRKEKKISVKEERKRRETSVIMT